MSGQKYQKRTQKGLKMSRVSKQQKQDEKNDKPQGHKIAGLTQKIRGLRPSDPC